MVIASFLKRMCKSVAFKLLPTVVRSFLVPMVRVRLSGDVQKIFLPTLSEEELGRFQFHQFLEKYILSGMKDIGRQNERVRVGFRLHEKNTRTSKDTTNLEKRSGSVTRDDFLEFYVMYRLKERTTAVYG